MKYTCFKSNIDLNGRDRERNDHQNMKRIIKLLTAASLLGCMTASLFVASAAAPEEATMPSEQEIITTVGILGIMNGDYYGDLHLDSYVTRAEFTKMALCTSALKDSANKSSQISPFSDVKPTHWASGYIVTAVSNNYIRGYVDGTFRPDRQVTLEEAATVILRILGYSELDSGKYPDSQLAKYEELNLDNMIIAQRGEPMTRRDCMYLMYNALCSETKSGVTHCQTIGHTTDSNGRIDYLNLISENMEGPVTVDAGGSYTEKVGIEFARATFYRDGEASDASELRLYDLVYYNRDVRTIWAYSDKTMGTVNSVSIAGITNTSPDYDGKAATSSTGYATSQTTYSSTTTNPDGKVTSSSQQSYATGGAGTDTYTSTGGDTTRVTTTTTSAPSSNSIIVDGATYKLSTDEVIRKFSSYGELKCDDFVMLMLDKDGNVGDAVIADRAMFDTYITDEEDKSSIIGASLKGPYTVTDPDKLELPFDAQTAEYYVGGKKISGNKLEKYDVYYYSVPFRSVWAYRESASGIVDSIYTGDVVTKSDNYKGNPPMYSDTIIVSGKTYSLGNEKVKYKFSAYGEITVDDFVLLLMDKGGNVADAVILDGETDSFLDEEDRIEIMDSTLKGPYTAMGMETVAKAVSFDLESAEIFYGTKKLSPSDIRKYDIFYYSEPFKSVWIYRNTEIGIIDSVNVSGVTSTSTRYEGTAAISGGIVLSGKNYTLGSDTVKNKFSAYGSFAPDDFVMLLLDKNGYVADVVYADSDILDSFLDEDDDRVALINSTLKGPYVLKSGESFGEKIPFDLYDAKIYAGTKTVSASYVKTNDVYYYSEPFNSVWIYRDTASGFVNSILPSREDPTSIIVGTKTYTLDGSTVKQQFSNFGSFEEDDFVTVLLGNGGTAVYATIGDIYDYLENNDDGVTYADLVAQSMDGPIIVKPGKDWEASIPFDTEEATFFRKNSTVDKSVIKDYDVLYYSKALSSVWVYTDKATGRFEAAAPSRILPTSVTISGKSYIIEGSGAAHAFSNMGSYKFGDMVTVLLGKDGGIVGVISGSDNVETLYGFITAFGEGTYQRPNGTEYTAENITIMGTDTQSYTYEYDDSGFTKGDFVSVTYIDGKPRITKLTSGVNASLASTVNSLIASGNIADDAVLLDVYVTTDSDSIENKTVTYSELYPSRLIGVKLTASNIYYAKTENGMLTELILKDFTGDIYTYGIVTTERSGSDFEYRMITGGTKTEISINPGYGTPSLGAAKFTLKGGKYIVKNLDGVEIAKENFGRGYSTAGGKTYNYASNVQYYIKTNIREYTSTTYDDILEGDYKITAYYDDTEVNGGRVRIIVAE